MLLGTCRRCLVSAPQARDSISTRESACDVCFAPHMLVYEDYSNVLSFFGEANKCLFDLGSVRLCIADQEVLLGVGRFCDMSDARKENACDRAVSRILVCAMSRPR
jgi:hypothetical protein